MAKESGFRVGRTLHFTGWQAVDIQFFLTGSATPVKVLVMPQYLSVTIVREQFQDIGIEVPNDVTVEQAKAFIRKHIESIESQLCYDTDWVVDSIYVERILPITEEAAIHLGMCTWEEIAECDQSAERQQ